MPIKLIIAGSRTVDPSVSEIDEELFKLELGWADRPRTVEVFRDLISEVICGGAGGADKAGRRWAEAREIPVHPEPITEQDIRQWGKYIGPRMRNRRMAERGDVAVIFWDGQSGGSADMCTRMVARRKFVEVVPTKRAVRSSRARVAEKTTAPLPVTPVCCERFVNGDGVHDVGCRRHG